jgi:hypothetical protein
MLYSELERSPPPRSPEAASSPLEPSPIARRLRVLSCVLSARVRHGITGDVDQFDPDEECMFIDRSVSSHRVKRWCEGQGEYTPTPLHEEKLVDYDPEGSPSALASLIQLEQVNSFHSTLQYAGAPSPAGLSAVLLADLERSLPSYADVEHSLNTS